MELTQAIAGNASCRATSHRRQGHPAEMPHICTICFVLALNAIRRGAAVTLLALAWSGLAFCGEMHDAAKSGDVEKVKALLKKNPALASSKDTTGTTPLHLAAGYGHKEVAELLLAHKARVNAKANEGDTPLHLAAFHGHTDVAELLLAGKAKVNAKDKAGLTPLHWASRNAHKDMVALLMARKANINAKDKLGQTPLRWATLGGHKEVAELLRKWDGHE
jgi:ankyrin repeat protein